MSINVKDIEQKASVVFGEYIEFAESFTLSKDEVSPIPVPEDVYESAFGNEEWVTTFDASDDDDNVYFAVTTEESKSILVFTQDSEGEFGPVVTVNK